MSKKRKTVDWVEFATTAYFAEKVGLATREEEVWMENMDWKYAELNPGRLTGANSSVIQDICESMLQGHPIHKPLLARLPSEKCFPVDGFRRSRAAKEAEQKSIQADVIVGVVGENGITMNVLRDLSVQCNRNGGLGIGREEAMVYAIDYVERLGYSRDRALEAALLPKGCKTNLSRKLLARKMVGDLVAYDVVEVLKIPETTLTAFMRVKGNMVILGECVKLAAYLGRRMTVVEARNLAVSVDSIKAGQKEKLVFLEKEWDRKN